jgi:hypothetical protein
MASFPTLAAGGRALQKIAEVQKRLAPMEWWQGGNVRVYQDVMFCRDVLDYRYGFPVDLEGHVIQPDVSPPDDETRGAEGPLGWWRDETLWGEISGPAGTR